MLSFGFLVSMIHFRLKLYLKLPVLRAAIDASFYEAPADADVMPPELNFNDMASFDSDNPSSSDDDDDVEDDRSDVTSTAASAATAVVVSTCVVARDCIGEANLKQAF